MDMQIELVFQLHDHLGQPYRIQQLEVNVKESIRSVMTKIGKIWSIEDEYQSIYVRDQLVSRLKSIADMKLTNDDVIVVKHSATDNWGTCAYLYETAKETRQSYIIKKKVGDAMKQAKILRSCNYFGAYPKYLIQLDQYESDFAHYMDNEEDYIKNSSQVYFSVLYNNDPECSTIGISFGKKDCGAKGGIICNVVTANNILMKFHIR